MSSVNIITQNSQEYYESCWVTVEIPYKQLYHEFIQQFRHIILSFFTLKPFYSLAITHNDMCCCKKQLHTRWATTLNY